MEENRLEYCMEKGWVTLQHKEYVYLGKAKDGTIVVLGEIGEEEDINAYLADHPDPTTW